MSRTDDLAAGLAATRARVEAACDRVGRNPGEVTLVVVTKHFPGSDVRLLHELGVRHVGESRHQEAARKHAELTDLDLTWHFVGSLQTNKAAAVASYSDVVHSVDRAKLVAPLALGAKGRAAPLDVLLQVDLDAVAHPGRGGARPEEVAGLAGVITAADALVLRGVMAVAPLGVAPGSAFARLAQVAAELGDIVPEATWISAGMSGDLEDAVMHGATHVRVGSAILGSRVYSR